MLKLKETSNFSHDDCQRSIDELKSELEARKVLIDQLDKDNVLLRSTKITLLEEIEVYRKLLDSLKIFSEYMELLFVIN